MKRRTILILATVLIVAAVALGILLRLQAVLAVPTLTITYNTIQTQRPNGSPCLGRGENVGVAKEILNLRTEDIFVAGGTNPMPDDIWTNYRITLPYLKNSTRQLLFDDTCFFRSPDAQANCTDESCVSIEEIFGFTWLKLTTLVGQSCFPDASGCSGTTVNQGYVSISTIAKCHEIIYTDPVIYELNDGRGNRYVMHATETGTPTIEVVLPTGWTLTEQPLDEPLVLLPFGGGNDCYYNIVRDHLVQSYHQFAYESDQYPPAP